MALAVRVRFPLLIQTLSFFEEEGEISMEIVYFVLGVVTVLLVFGVIIMVKVGTLVKELRENLNHLERGTQDLVNDVHRKMDDVNDTIHRRIDYEVRELNSILDSRLDKFESKLNATRHKD